MCALGIWSGAIAVASCDRSEAKPVGARARRVTPCSISPSYAHESQKQSSCGMHLDQRVSMWNKSLIIYLGSLDKGVTKPMARSSKVSEERKPEPKEEPVPERNDPTVGRSPDYKVQMGRVHVAVWKREIEERTIFSVSVTRSYLDRQQQWQRTTSLDEDDLLPAAKALDEAY